MTDWLCLYRKSNYDDADYFCETLKKASINFGLNVSDPEWAEMGDRDKVEEWTSTVKEYMNNHNYKFVVFLLDKNDNIYKYLKIHSLCDIGYVSQVVKVKSLSKNAMNVCSKILLQINSKLSGVSYIPKLEDNIKNKQLIIIGVHSSNIKNNRIGVAMVSTINPSFTNFYNKELIFNGEQMENNQKYFSEFIAESLNEYKKLNNKLPKGIVIYRKGVYFNEKKYHKDEIKSIKNIFTQNNLLYYYILANTQTSIKFFEKNNNQYSNPEGGLLLLDGVTNKNFFEFYIQPQQVKIGCANPSFFHVVDGDLDIPEMIPKLTFDLCHLYSNWQGAIRIPHVLKLAEKLSKMTSDYTLLELNNNLKLSQSYL